jgi:hypothetical protein
MMSVLEYRVFTDLYYMILLLSGTMVGSEVAIFMRQLGRLRT